jgi:hypothetical protein
VRPAAASCLLLTLASAAIAAEDGDRLTDQLKAIEAVVPSETPLFGLETRIQTAELLLPLHPELAHEWLHDALSAVPGISHGPSADYFRARIAGLLSVVDLGESLELARATRRWDAADRAGEAWDKIVRQVFGRSPAQAAAIATEGLRSGAYQIGVLPDLLGRLLKADEPGARALYSEVTGAFPSRATPRDATLLLDCMKVMGNTDHASSREGVRRLLAALAEESFGATYEPRGWWRVDGAKGKLSITTQRDLAAFRLIRWLRQSDPGLLAASQKQLKDWEERLTEAAPDGTFRISGGPSPEPEPAAADVRAEALVERSRSKDLTAAQAAALASEALPLTQQMKLGSERLVAQAILTRDAVLRGDDALAASAAKMLSDSFAGICHCETAACDSLEGREECSEMIDAFAEYLDEHQVTPEILRLYHPSLRARLLLLALKRLLS